MRIFELALFSISSLTFILLLARIQKNCRLVRTLAFLLMGIFLTHFLVEGYRWQMIPTYFMAITTILIIYRKLSINQLQLRLKWKGITAFVVISVFSLILPVLFPVFSFTIPTGPYDVGRSSLHLTDYSREETFTEESGDYRELMVSISYPIDRASHHPSASYIENAGTFLKAINKETGIPTFFLQYLKEIQTNGHENAAIAKGEESFPVIIFSHGFPGTRFMYTTLIEEVVSQGFVVISIDHSYHSSLTVFPDGKSAYLDDKIPSPLDLKAWDELIASVWGKDHQFILDFLEDLASDPFYKGKLDLERIGVMGHSFGGATAFQTLIQDDRVKLGINMDGTFFGEKVRTDAQYKPFLWMTVDAGQISDQTETPDKNTLKMLGMTNEEFVTLSKELKNRKKQFETYASDMVQINGTHMSFSDYYLFSPYLAISDKVNVHQQHQMISKNIVEFLKDNF
ncbi:alpha/beta hydrolase family protein [Cytobacillus sp. FJAT-54145]|uniref:Alpha/beta hydrolase family protein n=1 Tax=Cytobacillus spartinae TaxID=3299023 RepID=A0ABW6KDE5_9BACI